MAQLDLIWRIVFLGENYWKLTEDGVASGYPRLISRAWPGLPGNIDAAFTYKNGKTYFFKGSKYWRYNGQKVDGQYPKEISEGTISIFLSSSIWPYFPRNKTIP